jgi:hypothetical protein
MLTQLERAAAIALPTFQAGCVAQPLRIVSTKRRIRQAPERKCQTLIAEQFSIPAAGRRELLMHASCSLIFDRQS